MARGASNKSNGKSPSKKKGGQNGKHKSFGPAHDKLIQALRAQCTGVLKLDAAAEEDNNLPGFWETRNFFSVVEYVLMFGAALLRTGILRSILAGSWGCSLLVTGGILWLFGTFGQATWPYALVQLAGVALVVAGCWGLPGSLPFLEVKTKAGFYAKEDGPKCSGRNTRIREAFDAWMAGVSFTPYLRSGEFRTIGQFSWKASRGKTLKWERFWMDSEDKERIAYDWVFPPEGYNPDKPVVLILPGLAPHKHWTETCEFVADAVWHLTTRLGMTAVVCVPRGAMGTIVKENPFHAARVTDVRQMVLGAKEALSADKSREAPPMFLVGFSMGGIVLPNYCARYGGDEQIDGAACFSGVYHCEDTLKFEYSQKTWQVALALRMKRTLLTGKMLKMAEKRGINMKRLLSSEVASVNSFDELLTAPYNGYKDAMEYYQDTSCTGPPENPRYRSISIPLLGVGARDDPITHCDAMKAEELSKGNENLLFLVTDEGGHTGWPLGWKPWERGYDFINEAIGVFIAAVMAENKTKSKANGHS